MNKLFCLIGLLVLCVSCRRDENSASAPPREDHPQTNVASKFNENDPPTETVAHTPDGSVKHRTFFQTAEDGRMLSSRTVDREGNLKWTEEHAFGEGSGKRPLETRRTTPDGTIIVIRYIYDQNGIQKRIVMGPDGQEVPQEKQQDFLDE